MMSPLTGSWKMCCAAPLMLLLFAPGCQTPPDPEDVPPLQLPGRFSSPTMMPGMTDRPLGLIVDADPHPLMTGYAHRLAADIATEIQLISGSTIVVPYTDLAQQAPLLLPAYEAIREPAQETMTAPLQNLPPTIENAGVTTPEVDRLLVVQIIDLRPYAPMATTLRLTVVEAHSGTVVGQTTAVWDAAKPDAECCRPECSKKHTHCWYPDCDPSPLQNSPQAMLKLVSEHVALWYQQTLPQPVAFTAETAVSH